jgi:apolipoprotein N-acyltransferase
MVGWDRAFEGLRLRDPASSSLPLLPASLACAGSGVAYGLAVVAEPTALRAVLGLVALAPWLACAARVTPTRAVALAVPWTLAATAVVAAWLPATLVRFFGLGPAEALLGGLALALLVNLPPYLLLGAWLAWRARRGPVAPLVVAAAWLLAEWMRAHGPVPNPYALLGTSQVGAPADQVAELVGVFGLGALAAAVGAGVAAVWTPALRGRRPAVALGAVAACLALSLAFGAVRLATYAGEGEALRVAVVQPGLVPAREDPAPGRRLDVQLALSREALAESPDLLFWPEYAVAFYPREAGPERARFLAEAGALGTDLVFGGPHYRNAMPEPEYYASLFLLRDGALAGRTDKRRLVPFAEYDPLAGLGLGGDLAAAHYRPGRSVRPLEARSARVGGFLCGEVLFPGVARALAAAGATLLANPSNDGWFTAEAPARHQLRAAQLRAIENRRAVVRATQDGVSAVIDARGRVRAASGRHRAEVLAATVRASRVRTLHQRGPHVPAALALVVVVGSSAGALRRGVRPGEPR